MKKKIICVLGMHRSGTSLLSNLINQLGVFWGDKDELMEKHETNPDGFYELNHIVDIQERILEICQSSWDSCNWIENSLFDDDRIQVYKEHLKGYICQIYEKHNISFFGFKDPRTSILIPIWKEIFSELNLEALYIWAVRNPEEVVNSLLRRDEYRKEYGYCLWDYYNLKIIYDLQGESGMMIHYDDLMNQTYNICAKLHDFIFENGKVFNEDKINGVVKNEYRHSVVKKEIFENREITNIIMNFIRKIKSKEDNRVLFPVGEKIKVLYEKYIEQSKDFFVESGWAVRKSREIEVTKKYKTYYNLLLRWLQHENDIIEYTLQYLEKYGSKEIILYGLGTLGNVFIDRFKKKIKICCIIDEYQAEKLKSYEGIPVKKIKECHLYKSVPIVVTPVTEYILIQNNLKKQGIENDMYSLETLINRGI